MSDDKPMNAMYGQKVKLDLDKIRNRSKKVKEEVVEAEPVETIEEVPEAPVVEETEEEVVEQATVEDEPVEEEVPEEVVEEPVEEEPVEEVVEEAVDEPVEEEVPEEVVEEPVEEEPIEEVVEEAVDEPFEEVVEEKPAKKERSKKNKSDDILAEKDKKLANQSSELNYLTNKVIPKLKKENAELKRLKKELTDALEKSTRKYFDQLDINADLSNQIGKLGADGAVNKVRADKLEAELDSIKEGYEAKVAQLKEKLDSLNVDDIKKENNRLAGEVEDLKEKLGESRKENIALSEEVDKLRAEIIEIGNYKEEVDNQYKKEIEGYKQEISSLSTQLKVKESSYDKLSNESSKTISDLRKQVAKLEEDLEKQSNRGLFNRFK